MVRSMPTVTVLSILLLKTVPTSCLFIPLFLFIMTATRLSYISLTFNGLNPGDIAPDLFQPAGIFKLGGFMLESKVKQGLHQILKFGAKLLFIQFPYFIWSHLKTIPFNKFGFDRKFM